MKHLEKQAHQQIALWAAACAEHVIAQFEQAQPEDCRPRKAIQAARLWVSGTLPMATARQFAFAAHAAAREATQPEAIAAARAAGHAAATAHVASHARYAASYACKACLNPLQERAWQLEQVPAELLLLFKTENIVTSGL
ncbi:putative immunity protein [Pontibacter sp. 13R65]|uniref:putative immunity protein n=1 Tax=Pontibacter sp. 13R65 TaxID=3127458 RepID=UPI00301BDF86